MKDENGVWRTVRGRRIFIRDGESLGSAMIRSGKFNDNGKLPRREDYHKAKKQLAMIEANERENKAFDYVYKKPKDEKQKEQWKKKADKATENRIKKTKEYNDYMELYDKDRDDSELTWQDRAEKIHRQGEKIRESKSPRDNDYYDTYRNEEEQFAKIKQEPDDAPYESLPAYKTYQEKMMRLEKNNKSWTGKEYTNDEFMEHLTDANWHSERRMIEEAGLTNKQMTELKNQVKLSSWSANLDKKSTQELIDKVKKEFPAKDTQKTIDDYKAKKQSNNKINNDNKTITELNNEMLGDKYKGKGETPSLVYSHDRRIDIDKEGHATIWKEGKIERKTNLPDNVKGDKTKQYFDDYLGKLDNDNNETLSQVKVKGENNVIPRDFKKAYGRFKVETNSNKGHTDDRYEITKDDSGYHAKNLRTGETYATFREHLSNNNVFEFENTNNKQETIKNYVEKKKSNNRSEYENDDLAKLSGGAISTLKTTIPQNKLERIKKGTEIYYKGDMANTPGYFVVESFEPDKEKYMTSITLKEKGGEGRTKKIGAQQIENEYKNNYMNRFAFKEDYDKFRNSAYEQLRKYLKKKGK